jgi:hypothetical protein
MLPERSEVNLTPTSIAEGSLKEGAAGTVLLGQIVHGHCLGVTVTVLPADAFSRLPLSSTDRLVILAVPAAAGVQE